MVEDQSTNLYLNSPRGLIDLENLNSFNIYTNTNTQHNLWWSTLPGKGPSAPSPSSSSSTTTTSSSSGAGDGDELSVVFPPSSHENLVPAELGPSPFCPLSTPSPPSPLRESDPDPGEDLGPGRVVVPRWWAASARVLWFRVLGLWTSLRFGYGGGVVVRWDWPVGKLGVAAAAVVGWWLWVRLRRRRRREESVSHLLRIIREKDERISQLLNQIAQMNELLLARHRSLNVNN